MSFDPLSVAAGDELPSFAVNLTRADAIRYAGASTDFNPIHWSDRKAQELGLDGVLIHGMWTMGTALRVVTNWCLDSQRIVDYSTRFTRPVLIPDTDEGVLVEFSGTVKSVEQGRAVVSVEVRAGGTKVLGNTLVTVGLE